MKPVYSSLTLATGVHIAGICTIKIAAREWLTADPVIDHTTGKVLTAVTLTGGNSWLTLQLAPDSLLFLEKPKRNKAGRYYDVTISGLVNYLDATLRQHLESIAHHEMVALITDVNELTRIVGSKQAGLILEIGASQVNKSDGLLEVEIEMSMGNIATAPFYEV